MNILFPGLRKVFLLLHISIIEDKIFIICVSPCSISELTENFQIVIIFIFLIYSLHNIIYLSVEI